MTSGTALDRFLCRNRGEKMLLVPPAGNHGDALLHAGFRKRAREIGVPFTGFGDLPVGNVLDVIGDANPADPNYGNPRSVVQSAAAAALWAGHRAFPDFDAIYIHGGGNFNEIWGGGVGCFRTAATLFDCDIVVGPQSFLFETTDAANVLHGVGNDVRLFCRERYSYRDVDDAVGGLDNVDVELSPDTALYFERADLIDNDGTEEYTLIAFREDRESLGPHEVDLPDGTTTRREDVSDTTASLAGFVGAVARAERVYTDRLHVGILAAILGKPVTLYANAYHKNVGVYEYSLSGYDHVEFVDPTA